MNSSQLKKWADNAADAAGTAYGQGKHWLNFTRAHGQEMAQLAAKEARNNATVKRFAKALPSLPAQVSQLRHAAGENFSRMRDSFGNGLGATESMALKLTGVYLLVKWFQNRDRDASEIVGTVKSHILEKPLTSAVIALSIGYVFGRLRK